MITDDSVDLAHDSHSQEWVSYSLEHSIYSQYLHYINDGADAPWKSREKVLQEHGGGEISLLILELISSAN